MKGKGEQRVCKVFDAPNLPEAEAISFFFNKSITTCYSSIMHNFVFLNKKKAHLPDYFQMPKTRTGHSKVSLALSINAHDATNKRQTSDSSAFAACI